jgi:hypothetical protein
MLIESTIVIPPPLLIRAGFFVNFESNTKIFIDGPDRMYYFGGSDWVKCS